MASQIAITLKNLSSALKRLGIFDNVSTVEPKGAPGAGSNAALFLASVEPAVASSGLNQADGLYTFTLRLYTDMLREPAANIEPELAALVDKVMDALMGDFDLGETVRNVDFLGENGQRVRAEAGYIEVNGKMFRIVDVSLPLVVSNAFTEYAE